jgi:uncharacterized protein (DUF1501 family)
MNRLGIEAQLSRRALLSAGCASSVWLSSQLAFAAPGGAAPPLTLVCIFLRGAVDGLSLVVPYSDPAYYKARPTIGIAPPKHKGGVLDLDGRFGLHPRLGALKPAFDAGELAFVHAVGSPHPTRSHFEAQDYMETATPGERRRDGWLGRCLPDQAEGDSLRLPRVALSPRTPLALRGPGPVLSTPGLERFQLRAPGGLRPRIETAFAQMYTEEPSVSARAGANALRVAEQLHELGVAEYKAEHGAVYEKSATQLRDAAFLIKADLGLRVAWIDLGGWDTHQAQGDAEKGRLPTLLDGLGKGLSAFRRDLGPRLERVVVLVMSEFGRTVEQNGTQGTDHGHGTAMMLLGGSVNGRKVHGHFPGLAPEQRYEGRDLAVTTDFRDVFAELAQHVGSVELGAVLPGYAFDDKKRLGVLR